MMTPITSTGTASGAISAALGVKTSSDSTSTDFGSVLASLATDTRQSLKTGETAAISGLTGKMPLQQVVGAVMAAEQSLTIAIAVRDKVIGAYNEINRMSI